MTKLLEWVSLLMVIFGVWLGILTQNIGNLATVYPILTLWWPVGLVILFGICALILIVYRVITFNDCEDAAKELTKQIDEAKEDLKNKGLKF